MSSRSIAPRRSGLFVPLFDAFSDPATVAGLAADAEDAGWDGVLVWDHVRCRDPVVDLEHPDQLAQIVADLTSCVGRSEGTSRSPTTSSPRCRPAGTPEPYAAAGGTWWMVEFSWDAVSVDQVRGVIRDGPAAKAAPGG